MVNDGFRLEIRIAAEMTMADLRTHRVIVAGLSDFEPCTSGPDIFKVDGPPHPSRTTETRQYGKLQ
jgi:hypothetical protein